MDRVFEYAEVKEICRKLKSILKESENYMHEMQGIADSAERALAGVPSYAKESSVSDAAAQLRSTIKEIDLSRLETELGNCLESVEMIAEADGRYAAETEGLIGDLTKISGAIESIKEFLRIKPLEMSDGEFWLQMELVKYKCNNILGNMDQSLSHLKMNIKGLEMKSVFYSKDPVNLSTGNFIYAHTDISIPGCSPMYFRRFYNSVNHYEGCLGTDWNHNFEVFVNPHGKEMVLHLEDGREERFVSLANGTYAPLYHDCGEFSRSAGGWKYLTREQKEYYFDGDGFCTEIKETPGTTLHFHYEKELDRRYLLKAEKNTGEYFEFSYDVDGNLCSLEDHVGRKIHFIVEQGKLTSVTLAKGGQYCYSYTPEGKLYSIRNPEGIVTITNEYDGQMRTVRQRFPDGGEMRYSYNDEKKEVMLTERNGSKITYVHDGQFRDIRHIYRDGEESFEYNRFNQKTKYVDKMGNVTLYDYDSHGNRTLIVDPCGNRMQLKYGRYNRLEKVSVNEVQKVENTFDEKGALLSTTDAEGNIFRFCRDDKSHVSEIIQPDGGRVLLKRDQRGNITCLTDPNGAEHFFIYDELNQIAETIDGNGNHTRYEYDENGNLTKVVNAEGNTRTYSYNRNNKVVQITDFDGSTIRREYNALNLPTKITDQAGRITQFQYDTMWNLSAVTSPDGAETAFVYNEDNHLAQIRNAAGGVTSYTYDPMGRKTSRTNCEGEVSRFHYDALGNLIKVEDPEGGCTLYKYDAERRVTCVKDALGNEVHLKYDRNGRLIFESNPLGAEREYAYDSMGRLNSIKNEVGQITVYEYDKCGNLIRIIYPEGKSADFTYDKNGNIKTYTTPKGYVVRYFYDSLDRLIKSEGQDGESSCYEYDCLGNVLAVTDSQGAKTCYEYSATGKLTKVTDPAGNETVRKYDSRDRLIEICQFNGTEAEGTKRIGEPEETECRRTVYEYNILGKLTKIMDNSGCPELFEYDKAGRLTSKVDREGYVTEYGYSTAGLLGSIKYADGKEVKLSYNPIRQLVMVEDWIGVTRLENDAMGHITCAEYPDGSKVSYTYGRRGERTGITYPDGSQIKYEYNGFSRLSRLGCEEWDISYEYDDWGFLKKKVFPNSSETEYQYDAKGKLTALRHFSEGKPSDEYLYKYDCLGRKAEVIKRRSGVEEDSGKYEYTYDVLGRLTDVTRNGTFLRAYAYDAFGNRTFMRDGDLETQYIYNALDQLTVQRCEGTEKRYEYDKRGNLSRISEDGEMLNQYVYGPDNRLRQASSHGEKALYIYNGLGQRVGKDIYAEGIPGIDGGTPDPISSVSYCVDTARRYHNLLQINENGNNKKFFWDNGIAALEQTGERMYYQKDELGSPIRLLDAKGGVRTNYVYDEFGNMVGRKADTEIQPFGFTGYQYDKISETYFAQAREYSCDTGRFISKDFISGFSRVPITLNRYAYCFNDPICFTDRTGMWPSLDDICDTLGDWGDEIGNTLDDWGDNINSFLTGAREFAGQAVDTIAEAASVVVEPVVTGITQLGNDFRKAKDTLVGLLEMPAEFILNSPVMLLPTVATQMGWLDWGLEIFDFHRDDAGIFHTSPDCWQQYMGYCNFYDWMFDVGTSMEKQKYPVITADGQEYCIWMWKGDYLNLGAGAETGIYTGGEPFWQVSVEDAMPMELALYDSNGNVILSYDPEDPQWWITGFDPMTQGVSADDLIVIGSIDMSSNPELFESFKKEYGQWENSALCFDEENQTVYYMW